MKRQPLQVLGMGVGKVVLMVGMLLCTLGLQCEGLPWAEGLMEDSGSC